MEGKGLRAALAILVGVAILAAAAYFTLVAPDDQSPSTDIAASAPEPPRLALVIGNNGYQNITKLDKAVGDAELIAEQLESVGFTVFLHTDVTKDSFDAALQEFTDVLNATRVDPFVVVYYAGHGVESNGENFLIPVDIQLPADAAADFDMSEIAVSTADMMDQLVAAPGAVRFVLFDACRDSPFPNIAGGGLARMERPEANVFIGYATSPGRPAFDDAGAGHSPYTDAIAENLVKPGVPAEITFRKVRYDVVYETNEAQIPWDSSSLVREICFASCMPDNRGKTEEELTFAFAVELGAREGFEGFLAQFPDTVFAERAQRVVSANAADVVLPPEAPWTAFSDNAWSVTPWRALLETTFQVVTPEQLQAAADAGDADAATLIGSAYQQGARVAPDLDLALSYSRAGCEGGNYRGCSNAGWVLWSQEGGEAVDVEAADLFERGCLDGSVAAACSNLGAAYALGRGRASSPEDAVRFYELACNAGDALACSNLASMYLDGVGVEADAALGAELLADACAGGSGPGCANLGILMLEGGAPAGERSQDEIEAEAVGHLTAACDQNVPAGCMNLGLLYLNGEAGLEESELQAIGLLRKAAGQVEDLQMRDQACLELELIDLTAPGCE